MIFQYFDYNIAYEIRLHKALEEEMLSPFHYYGVTDVSVNGQIIDDNAAFDSLTSNERLDKIIEKSSFYGCDSGDVGALYFVQKWKNVKYWLLNLLKGAFQAFTYPEKTPK